jgi:hypothetical protein
MCRCRNEGGESRLRLRDGMVRLLGRRNEERWVNLLSLPGLSGLHYYGAHVSISVQIIIVNTEGVFSSRSWSFDKAKPRLVNGICVHKKYRTAYRKVYHANLESSISTILVFHLHPTFLKVPDCYSRYQVTSQ